jgi:hypothetical protein
MQKGILKTIIFPSSNDNKNKIRKNPREEICFVEYDSQLAELQKSTDPSFGQQWCRWQAPYQWLAGNVDYTNMGCGGLQPASPSKKIC